MKEGVGELANQISSLAESMKAFVEKAAIDEETKVKAEKEAAAQKEEDAEKAAEKKEDEKEKVTKAADNGELGAEVKRMSESVASLKTLVEKTLPMRRAEGSESHKEDNREQKEEEKDVTKSQEFKDKKGVDPVGRLKMLLGKADEAGEKEEE